MTVRFYLAALLAAMNISPLAAEQSKPDAAKQAQLREEVLEQLLITLEHRCLTMRDLQVAAYEGTKALHKIIESHADKKPRPEDQEAASRLAESQKAIVTEATTAINMLLAEGTAVAFPEVFEQV